MNPLKPAALAAAILVFSPFSVAQDEEYNEEEIAERLKDHALFIAFAPYEDPQIAVAVIVENGSHGGSTAGPIARATLDAYLLPKEKS